MEKKIDYTLRYWFKPRPASRQMGGIVAEIHIEGQPLALKPMPIGIRCSRSEWNRANRKFQGIRAARLTAELTEIESDIRRAAEMTAASGLPIRPETIWQTYQRRFKRFKGREA